MSEPDSNLHNRTGPHNGGTWTAEAVRAFRHARRQNQTAFAADVGVSRGTVAEWEAGKSPPTGLNDTALTDLAREFGWMAPTVAETVPKYGDAVAPELIGRAHEIEALMSYALERQRLLLDAMRGEATPPAVAVAVAQSLARAIQAPAAPKRREK